MKHIDDNLTISDEAAEEVEAVLREQITEEDAMAAFTKGADPLAHLSDEEKEKCRKLIESTQAKPPEPPKPPELPDGFKAGQRIDGGQNGINMRIIGTGPHSMRVTMCGKKARRLKWRKGYTVSIGGHAFVVGYHHHKEAHLEYLGPAMPQQQLPDMKPKRADTMLRK